MKEKHTLAPTKFDVRNSLAIFDVGVNGNE